MSKLNGTDWLAACCPVPASADHSDLEAARHALWKWHGARADVLEFFGCRQFFRCVIDASGENIFDFSSDSCSLCQRHFDSNLSTCGECPLRDKHRNACRNDSFGLFGGSGDPSVMLRELTALVAELEAQQ